MRIPAATALAALLMTPAVGMGQFLDSGTYDVEFQELRREGVLDGCSLVFIAVANDYAYLKGAQIVMNGSIAVRTLEWRSLSFTGKLGTRKLLGSNDAWESPVHFYFSSSKGTTAGKATIAQSDSPGFRLLVADALDDSVMLLLHDIHTTGQFTVGFNRVTKGQDVYSPILVNVSLRKDASGNAQRVVNEQTNHRFSACIASVLDTLASKLRK